MSVYKYAADYGLLNLYIVFTLTLIEKTDIYIVYYKLSRNNG